MLHRPKKDLPISIFDYAAFIRDTFGDGEKFIVALCQMAYEFRGFLHREFSVNDLNTENNYQTSIIRRTKFTMKSIHFPLRRLPVQSIPLGKRVNIFHFQSLASVAFGIPSYHLRWLAPSFDTIVSFDGPFSFVAPARLDFAHAKQHTTKQTIDILKSLWLCNSNIIYGHTLNTWPCTRKITLNKQQTTKIFFVDDILLFKQFQIDDALGSNDSG